MTYIHILALKEAQLKDEKFTEYFNKIAQAVVAAGAIGGKGSGVWRSIKRELENKSKRQKSILVDQ